MTIAEVLRYFRKRHDPAVRFELLTRIGSWLSPNYRFKWPQMEWWDDPYFKTYLQKFSEHRGLNSDRRWMIYQLIRLVEDIQGDTAECGVFRGAGSYLICHANQYLSRCHPRRHHMFDSFEGLPAPSAVDGEHWVKGAFNVDVQDVRNLLSEFDNLHFYVGWIPDRFDEIADCSFAFVHIDVDLYQPTKDCIEFFYPRMNPGGIILCDDYGFTTCPGATKAVDEFLTNKSEAMVSLSAGGGFIIKGRPTLDYPESERRSSRAEHYSATVLS